MKEAEKANVDNNIINKLRWLKRLYVASGRIYVLILLRIEINSMVVDT
jgi:hypothetical protein